MPASGQEVANLDYNAVLDHLGAGLLIFNQQNQLVLDNNVAARILGPNIEMIRTMGWQALVMIIDAQTADRPRADELRQKSQRSGDAIRFSILLSGTYMPCWISVFPGMNGQPFTQVVIDNPDWSALQELMSTFRSEARSAINDTSGHANFIRNLMTKPPANITAKQLGEKALGMVNLISKEMHQLQRLVDLLHRLELIRIGQLPERIQQTQRAIDLEEFLEDFLEELNEEAQVNPALDAGFYYERLHIEMDEPLYVRAPKAMLRSILRDLIYNAFSYSEPPSPVTLRIESASQGRHIQFDVIDEGCGIAEREEDRVFEPFQRARQPQVMREHGYGLSLYLSKAEVETMGGRIWFESQEGVGSVFSFKLPNAGGST
ncbi:MAG: sensor histidine kinase [Anaerolineales bacterium]